MALENKWSLWNRKKKKIRYERKREIRNDDGGMVVHGDTTSCMVNNNYCTTIKIQFAVSITSREIVNSTVIVSYSFSSGVTTVLHLRVVRYFSLLMMSGGKWNCHS